MNRCLTLGLLLACLTCVLGQVPEVDSACLNCICQASSNCDETLKCFNSGGGAYFCGPYVISWAYWSDGGRPGDRGGARDFETCLQSRSCAEQAVRGYMRRYGRDCDNSGSINCYDFARIHKLGFGACGGEDVKNTEYWRRFDACYAGTNDVNYGGDGDYGGSIFIDYGDDKK